MLKQFKISVTQDDIDSGCKESPLKCAVALAIQRVIGKKFFPSCGVSTARIHTSDSVYAESGESTYFDDNVSKFIIAFDAGKEVKPFSFDLELDLPGETTDND